MPVRESASILRELEENGYARWTLNLSSHPEADLCQFVSTFSRPSVRGRKDRAPEVVTIKPEAGFDPQSFKGTDAFSPHTDSVWLNEPPRYMTLLCIEPEPEGGGDTVVIDGEQVLHSLGDGDRRVLETEPVIFRTHFDAPTINYRELTTTVVENLGGTRRIRYRRDLMLGNVPAAVDRFSAALEHRAIRFRLQRGEAFVADNYRALHGRTPLAAGLKSNRLLLRIHSAPF